MEYTPIGAVTAADHPAADRAPGYKLPAVIVDGNDVVVVRDAVAEAAQRARAGDGPTVIEAETYRHYGHSRTDPAKYRPAEEVELWMKHDPIDVARARLEALGVAPDQIKQLDDEATAEVADAMAAAKAAPAADVAEAFTDVWADGGAQWRR
jgi:pyruvate dehydrogenase E1 component alpha subunit